MSGAFDQPSAPSVTRWTAGPGCDAPALPGSVVDVTVSDMGGRMMGNGNGNGRGPGGAMMAGPELGGATVGRWPAGMMRLTASTSRVPAGTVSLRVVNRGTATHETVVLPLPTGQRAGQRAVGADGKVGEAGSLGEASRTCGAGEGGGIAPGEAGWVSLPLRPGHYELICNLPDHYTAGMFTELDVT